MDLRGDPPPSQKELAPIPIYIYSYTYISIDKYEYINIFIRIYIDRGFERRPTPIPERTCPYPYSNSDKEKMYYSGGGPLKADYLGQLKPEYAGDQRFKSMAPKNQISDQMVATHNAYLQQVRIHENKVAQESHNSYLDQLKIHHNKIQEKVCIYMWVYIYVFVYLYVGTYMYMDECLHEYMNIYVFIYSNMQCSSHP
jgi:hypothetical protein